MKKLRMYIFILPLCCWIFLKALYGKLYISLLSGPVFRNAESEDDFDLVCISHVSWAHIWQRNHHTMTQIAKHRKVIYCYFETAHVVLKYAETLKPYTSVEMGNLIYTKIIRLPGESQSNLVFKLNKFIAEMEIKRLAKKHGFKKPVLWFYFPFQDNIIGSCDEKLVVYDIQDNYEAFAWTPKKIVQMEERLIKKTDVLFTGTDALKEKNKNRHSNITFFPCGVEFDHFAKIDQNNVPDEIKNLKKPILGYFGLIDNRIDPELLSYMAEKHPEWNIFMIGPVDKHVFQKVFHDNLHFIGQKEYKMLPLYLQRWDICIMPWAMNDLTKNINPTKTLEYFASGKPVVTTAIPDIVKYYSDVLGIAFSKEEFVTLCEEALKGSPKFNLEKGLDLARKRSWEYIVGSMQDIIKKELKKKK